MIIALPFSPFSLIFFSAGGLLLAVALITYKFGTKTGTRDWFLVLLLADGAWALASIVPLEAGDQQIAFAAEALRITTSGVAAVAWVAFAIVYRGYESSLTARRLLVLAVPLAVHVVAFVTNGLHGLSVTAVQISVDPATTVITYEFGPIYALATVYSLALVSSGTVLVIETAVRDPDLFADQSVALFVGSIMPIIGVVLTLTGAASPGSTNLTPALLTITAVAYGYALFRADLLKTSPQVAAEGRSIAIESLEEGFLIVDGTGQVIEANEAARALLGAPELAGQKFSRLLPTERREENSMFSFRTEDGIIVEAQVVSATESTDDGVGRIVTLRNVTNQRQRQERLEVLHRVLRHNVRNELSIVQGYASELVTDEETEVGPEVAGVKIVESSKELLSITEKARRIEKRLDSQLENQKLVSVPALVEQRVNSLHGDVDSPITTHTDLPEDCEIRTDRLVLGMVIDELLHNAVQHSDQSEPVLSLSVSAHQKVVIRVADDGPGIPEQERKVVLTGSETPLEHSSGFGLWTVRWGVRRLNGELSIQERSPRGTVVEIALPRDIASNQTESAQSREQQ